MNGHLPTLIMGGWLIFASPLLADNLPVEAEGLFGVRIREAALEPASVGDSARLSILIDNDSPNTVHLDAIGSEISTGGELVFDGPFGRTVSTAGFAVMVNETLDLASSHIAVRLTGLKRMLRPDEHVVVRLIFRTGEIHVLAHVRMRS